MARIPTAVAVALAFVFACRGAPPPPAPPAPAASGPAQVAAPEAEAPLAIDPSIRVGQLDNGLTYYVRRAERPKNRAQLWLAVNAGSVLEDDDQRGLAHFVEHMAFNGTEHFEKQAIVDYMERIGMQFGPHVNAYTSFDQTVYQLQIPTDDPAVVETALAIAADWAHAVSLEADEIEKERGVVLEEWRSGRGASARLRDEQFPVLFAGSRYADRLPIGKPEIIKNAPPEALVRFYRDWYRPELMAVIAVGDFDPAAMERKIRETFGALEGPASPRERPVPSVPAHEETRVVALTDPELTSASVSLLFKRPRFREQTESDYRRYVIEALFHRMLNARLGELQRQADPPFLFAGAGAQSFIRSVHIEAVSASVKRDGIERGLATLARELARIDRHGFADTELERAKVGLLRQYQQSVKEQSKRTSASFAAEILRNFLEGELMPGIERELEMLERFLPTIDARQIADYARLVVSDASRVVVINAPAGTPMPKQKEVVALVDRVGAEDVTAWSDQAQEGPLVAEPPAPGTIVERDTIESLGVTRWKLSNGVRVILKPTDFENDRLVLSGFSSGGTSLAPDARFQSARFADTLVGQGGLGEFDAVALTKALTGKVARASAWISELEQGVSAGGSPEDAETMFQLVYLAFTQPRKDAEAFAGWQARIRERVANRLSSPNVVFSDRYTEVMSRGHRRRQPLTEAEVDKVDLDEAFAFYQQRFADASGVSFVIVGNFEVSELEPLVTTYLASLPARGRKERWKDVGVRRPRRVEKFTVRAGVEPKAYVRIAFVGDARWSRQAQHDIRSVAAALRMRLREVLREDMGGTYSVGVSGGISRWPRQQYVVSIRFGAAPQNVDALIEATLAEIAALKKQGIGDDYIAKIKQAQRRGRETALRSNNFWLGALASHQRYGTDPTLILQYDELVDSVSSERVRAAARTYLDTKRYVQGVLLPADEQTAK